jgi:hypothetical protein
MFSGLKMARKYQRRRPGHYQLEQSRSCQGGGPRTPRGRSMQPAGCGGDLVCAALSAGNWDRRSRRGECGRGGRWETKTMNREEAGVGGRYRSGGSEASSEGGHLPKPTTRREPVGRRTRARGRRTAASGVTRARTYRSIRTKRYSLCVAWTRPLRAASGRRSRRCETNAFVLDLTSRMR